jgi:toxin ParE1/3/4
MRLRLSKLALLDLEDIHDYTQIKWGEEQAMVYSGHLVTALENIAKSPERWRLRNDLHTGCRVCMSGKHAILYRIRETQVEVARILHGAMDFSRHLPPNSMDEE